MTGDGQRAESGAGTSLTLLQRVRANDHDAWARLVGLYAPLVRYWCARGGLRPEDADDVVQEVFQAALIGLEGFRRDRPGDTFRGWLRGVARNRIALHYRHAARRAEGQGGSDARQQLEQVPQPPPPPDEEDTPAELNALYHRALDLVRGEFEERTWQMFWLAVVENQPVADVAARFAVSPAAVRKAKSRVLSRLKEAIGDVIR
jgi:RNA polymerase sigma-70 factor (ECF subfamily)